MSKKELDERKELKWATEVFKEWDDLGPPSEIGA